ncbi:restriction endonuclease subunit S [Geodermatophilus sp. SYSU D01186]
MNLNLGQSAWKRVALGDVADASKEKVDPAGGSVTRYVAGEHMDTDDLKIHRWGQIGDGYLGPAFHRRFRPGQVLYGSRRTYLRKVAVADFDGVCSNTTFVVQPRDDQRLLPEFLPWIMTSEPFHAFAVSESKGSVNPYVNWSDIAQYQFDLPPVDEQKRIADLLWAAERHRLAVAERDRLVESAIEARLDEWWTSMRRQPIAQIAECVTGSTPSRSRPDFWDVPEVPFVTPSEINGRYADEPKQWVSSAGAAAGRVVPANTVAVVCIGGALGKVAVLGQRGITNQQITGITGLAEDDAALMQTLLAHKRGQAALEARESTTIVRKLNKSDLMKIEVPWPNAAERAACLSLVEAREIASGASRASAEGMRSMVAAIQESVFGRRA